MIGFNMYKEIEKIKSNLIEKNYDINNIPLDDFARTLMISFGMKKETVRKWLTYLTDNKIIEIDDPNQKVKIL